MEATPNAYAAQLVAYMCVEHMKTNGDCWPTGWSELIDDFEPAYTQSGQVLEWTMSDLKERVEVNWIWIPSNPTPAATRSFGSRTTLIARSI